MEEATADDGGIEGTAVGFDDGEKDGTSVGTDVGDLVGLTEEENVGKKVGLFITFRSVGVAVGFLLILCWKSGVSVGFEVGIVMGDKVVGGIP